MDAATAKTSKYKVGEKVPVLTLDSKSREFTLVGIYGYAGNRDTIGGAQIVAFTTEAAQELLLGEKNVYSNVDVIGAGRRVPHRAAGRHPEGGRRRVRREDAGRGERSQLLRHQGGA